MAIPDPPKADSPFCVLQTGGFNPKTPEINNFFIPLFSFRRGYFPSDAPPPTFRMILRLLRTWTRSDCGETVHSCDYTRGLAAPTHIRLATARAVALL